jgi:nifR3 family TIM-barrel protein
MAEAARIVESRGADIVDVNMGCPVPKIARNNAGCSLMREPARAAAIVAAMVAAVKIPVTVKMRAGWDEREINAPEIARRVADAGAAALAVHGRTAAQAYTGHADWDLIGRVAMAVRIPVFGCGDLVEPRDILERVKQTNVAGVLIGRGILRNPWLFAQAADLLAGRPVPEISARDRGQFLLDYIDLLVAENPDSGRWIVNKLRALCGWYIRGFEGGSNLRVAVNHAASVAELRVLVATFFGVD